MQIQSSYDGSISRAVQFRDELSFQWTRLSLQLERIIIRQVRPPYNDRIAQED